MSETKLRKATFRYIEQEIYSYHETKKRFDEMTHDIIHYSPPYEEIRKNEPSDPTGKIATELATNIQMKRMEEIIYAIQLALIEMHPEHRDIIEDKYWKRPHLSWSSICEHYHIHHSTSYRIRSVFIYSIARRMGYSG